MKKLIICIIIMLMIVLPLVHAKPPFETSSIVTGIDIQLNQRFYVPIDNGYILRVHAFNQSNGILLNNTTTNCTLHFNSPNGTVKLFEPLNYNSTYEEYFITLTKGNFTTPGRYPWVIYCQSTQGMGGFLEGLVETIPGGVEFTEARAILYVGLLAILIFTFLTTFFGIGLLPQSNMKDEKGQIIKISWLKYLRNILWIFEWMLLISIFYVASNLAFAYMGTNLLAQILFILFRISFGITPIIITLWIMYMIAQIIQDKEITKLWEKGIFPQGNL